MEISKTFETPNGTVQFQGELNQEELDFVLQVGLNLLLEQGMIPFQMMGGHDLASLAPEPQQKEPS